MSNSENKSTHWVRFMNRAQARRAVMRHVPAEFTTEPVPRTIGSLARGRQLSSGNFVFAGHLLQQPGTEIWDLDAPDAAFTNEIHGFVWLDDLAAATDAPARSCAQSWLMGWIDRFGKGHGPGWTPELTGRRLIRWINHALFVLKGLDGAASEPFFRSLAQQTAFLGRRWQVTQPGLPRFEALIGLLYASLSLKGMEAHIAPASEALARECETGIDAQGGIPSRNPEELLEVFTLLTWAADALGTADQTASREHWQAIERIAPTLRTLRHADGGLARFHGGGRGLDGRLDQALAASGVKTRQPDGLSMGFARLSAGRTSVIVDAAAPPGGKATAAAHASALAFELTSGRRPLIVNCGSGSSFGPKWRKVGRATSLHSTLVLDGQSSAYLGGDSEDPDKQPDQPLNVQIELSQTPEGLRFEGAHDGYERSCGLTHARKIEMTSDGRTLTGEDMLIVLAKPQEVLFDKAMDETRMQGLPYDIRFHLHPDADAKIDLGGTAVSIALPSGEVWVFRTDGRAKITIELSTYLEKTRLKPRVTKQIVLSGTAMGYATRIRWSLAKAQDTPISIRDLAQDASGPLTRK